MNLPIIALLLAEESQGYELPIPAVWYGTIMFILLMGSLMITLAFSNKGRELPADTNADH